MHVAIPAARPRASAAITRATLGAHHPLARAQARTEVLLGQSAAVTSVAALSAGAWVAAVPAAPCLALLIGAAVVQAGLGLALVLNVQARRDAVLCLIAEGRDGLPLAAVARRRRRLLDPAHRQRLARSLDDLRREARRPPRVGLPLYSRRVVRSVDGELARVADLLRATDATACGVAQAVVLLSGFASPLYGDDLERLRRELGRLGYQLRATAPDRD
jgi:hypothetical protein